MTVADLDLKPGIPQVFSVFEILSVFLNGYEYYIFEGTARFKKKQRSQFFPFLLCVPINFSLVNNLPYPNLLVQESINKLYKIDATGKFKNHQPHMVLALVILI